MTKQEPPGDCERCTATKRHYEWLIDDAWLDLGLIRDSGDDRVRQRMSRVKDRIKELTREKEQQLSRNTWQSLREYCIPDHADISIEDFS